MVIRQFFISIQLIFITFSCINSERSELSPENQHVYISNFESNNSGEFEQIIATKFVNDTIFFPLRTKQILKLINAKNWLMGQGTGKNYYDVGKEVLFTIKKINPDLQYLIVENSKLFNKKFPVVFWKTNTKSEPWINLDGSWSFSQIVYDSAQQNYFTHLYPCNSLQFDILVASSKNLLNWEIKRQPVIPASLFNEVQWNYPKGTAPLISDIIHHNNRFHSFCYSDDQNDQTYISILTSDSLNGSYNLPKEPCISPNPKSEFSNHDVYFPHVLKIDTLWKMFYTSKNKDGEEYICIAESSNLTSWKTINENIIERNSGWNSSLSNQMVSQTKYANDTLWLWVTGVKDTKKGGIQNKGNVLDICIGKYFSIMPFASFTPMKGNPFFGGDPSLEEENDHIGASFQEIKRNDSTFYFYISKGTKEQNYKLRTRITH